ncbi:MAG: hypothetical protein U0359_40145 [Byssovorax sp.]
MSNFVLWHRAALAVVAGAALAACGAEFTANGTTSTTTTSTTGSGGGAGGGATTTTTGSGGVGGSTTTTTGAGGAGGSTTVTTTGSGGTGGGGAPPCMPGDLSTCGPGQFCEAKTGTCVTCAGAASFTFAAPVPLGLSPPYPPSALFPRIGQDGQLLFRFRQNQNSDLGFALAVPGAPMQWASATPEPSPLINTLFNEEGPLYLPNGAALAGLVSEKVDTNLPVLLFDSNVSGQRRVYAANLAGAASSEVKLKSQGVSYLVAVAYQANPPRFFYYSNFFPAPPDAQLGTSTGGEDPVKLPIVLDNGCHARGEVMPWVTPDGAWMFLSAPYPDIANGCAPLNGAPAHLFALPLDASGLPAGGAKAAAVFPGDQNNQVSPSLSPDQCTLYFSQIGPNGAVMYGAVRE